MRRSTSILTFVHIFLLATLAIGLSGCAFMSDEDKDFYGKGWVNPRELDQQPHHVIPNPEAPEEASQAPAAAPQAPANNGSHPSSESDEWTAPSLN